MYQEPEFEACETELDDALIALLHRWMEHGTLYPYEPGVKPTDWVEHFWSDVRRRIIELHDSGKYPDLFGPEPKLASQRRGD